MVTFNVVFRFFFAENKVGLKGLYGIEICLLCLLEGLLGVGLPHCDNCYAKGTDFLFLTNHSLFLKIINVSIHIFVKLTSVAILCILIQPSDRNPMLC